MSLFKVSIDRLKGRNVSTKTKNRKQKKELSKKLKSKEKNKKEGKRYEQIIHS